MTPPLPLLLKDAEIRLAGDTITVSAHGMSVASKLRPELAAAIWKGLGTTADQVRHITIRRCDAGVELVRVDGYRKGVRVWIGPYSIVIPVRPVYWLVLHSLELQEREEVANVA